MTHIKKIERPPSFNSRRTGSSKNTYTCNDHLKFLDVELEAQNQQFLRIINRKAGDLLEEGLLIPGMFMKVDEGHLIVKISRTRSIPRKGDYMTAVLLEGDMPDHRRWDEKTWRELRINHQVAISEAICVWQSLSSDNRFFLVGFRGVSLEFAKRLDESCIIIFGPKEPPREYLMNLYHIAENKTDNSQLLDFELVGNRWNPTIFDISRNFPQFVLAQLNLYPYLIIQGPPGTGKTYKLAELVAELLRQNKKILVTALTNRALIELAKKEHLQEALEKGLIRKSKLTIDEIKEVPGLGNPRKDDSNAELSLSTFYLSSKEAAEAISTYYDFVIMDEASQALLGMFEATIRLGRKVIWIGDQNQLPPIVMVEEKDVNHSGFLPLIQGMRTLCENFPFPSLMLNQTFRLSNRGASFTSYFYSNNLVSAKHQPERYFYHNLPKELQYLFNRDGGPFWLKTTMPVGEKCPVHAIQLATWIVKSLHLADKSLDIAVVSKLKRTITQLQVHINSEIGETEKVLIDTVERVQGMTCDVCVFVIPNTSLAMSLNQSFFNVATSRASRHTIIIADESVLKSPSCKGGTKLYLEALTMTESYKTLKD